MESLRNSVVKPCLEDLRHNWRQLLVADLVYKAIAFAVLAPLVSFLFRLFLTISGRKALADEDILLFMLSPIGWLTAIVVGAVAIGVLVCEQAAFMTIIVSRWRGTSVNVRQSLLFVASRVVPILNMTARLIARTLVVSMPFVVIGGLVYKTLLTEYDINYYLSQKPPVFLVALGIGGVLVLGLVAVLLPMLIARVFALPIILFEGQGGDQSLATSCQRTHGHRRRLLLIFVVWGVANFILGSVATFVLGWSGQQVIEMSRGSMKLLIAVTGLVVIAWAVLNYVTTLVAYVSFATVLSQSYRKFGLDRTELPSPDFGESSQWQFAHRLLSLNRWTVAFGVTVAILAALLVGVSLIESIDLQDSTQIIAHRGASGSAPENTLAAVEQAIEDGADWVEIDVQESADGVVVVAHDSDLKKLGGPGTKIWDATADELRQVDIGSWFDPSFADERMPTLEEVLRACQGKAKVTIELKYYGHNDQLENRVIEIVESLGMQNEIVTMSLKQDLVSSMKKLRPKWRSGLLTATSIGRLDNVEADFLAVNTGMATRRFIDNAHRQNRKVYVWTVNDPITMFMMVGRGADSLITDHPALAKSVLRQRAEMTHVEHLLLDVACLLGAAPKLKLTLDDV